MNFTYTNVDSHAYEAAAGTLDRLSLLLQISLCRQTTINIFLFELSTSAFWRSSTSML